MGVQRLATERNAQAEMFIDFILTRFSSRLHREGFTEGPEEAVLHAASNRDDARDVFDHFLPLTLVREVGGLTGDIELWGQTTCYKGNETGKAEPNKTYEIRETVTEALGLRRWLIEEEASARTLHFTLGPSAYTYGWFAAAKDSAFDLSLYPTTVEGGDGLFDELAAVLGGATTEHEALERLASAVEDGGSATERVASQLEQRLYEWFTAGMPVSILADAQADLLAQLRDTRGKELEAALLDSARGGLGIKTRAVALLSGGETEDAALVSTLKRLTANNPFLPVALEAENNWSAWAEENFAVPAGCNQLTGYISHLWSVSGPGRLVNRRLLSRVRSTEDVYYVQDTGIAGLTEHNLYSGNHSTSQVAAVSARVASACIAEGLATPHDLKGRLCSGWGRRSIKAALSFESRNGTNLKPSFDYIEEVLKDGYDLVKVRDTPLPLPVAYHSAFTDRTVKPYDNMKAVLRKRDGALTALIKVKFFSVNEFARRAKEEAYVGLTTKFTYNDGVFRERYPGMPVVMFVDTPEAFVPPAFAVTRLVTSGWDVFFSAESLRAHLDALPGLGRRGTRVEPRG